MKTFQYIQSPVTNLVLIFSFIRLFAPGISQLKISNQILENYFSPKNADYQSYLRFKKKFQLSDEIYLGLDHQASAIAPPSLLSIKKFSDELKTTGIVGQIHSLANAPIILPSSIGFSVYTLLDSTQVNLDWLQQPLVKPFLSQSRKQSLVIASLTPINRLNLSKHMNSIEGLTSQPRESIEKIHLLGLPILQKTITQTIQENLKFIAPLSILLMLALLLFLTRSLTLALLPIGVVLSSLAVTFGLAGYLGYPLSGLSMGIPQVLLAIATCDSLHIIFSFLKQDRNKKNIEECLKRNFTPTLLTTLTTAVSFLSFSFSEIIALQNFGRLCAFGTICAWIFTYLLAPAVLLTLKRRGFSPRFPNLSLSLHHLLWIKKHRKPTVVATMVFTAIGVWSSFQIPAGLDFARSFQPQTQISRSIEFFKTNFNISSKRSYQIKCQSKDCVFEPQFLKKLHDMNRWIATQSKVTQSFSLLTPLSQLELDFSKLTPTYIKDKLDIIQTTMKSTTPEKLWISPSREETRLEIFFNESNLSLGQIFDKKLIDKFSADGFRVTSHSPSSLMGGLEEKVISIVKSSLLITLLGVSLLMFFLFQNLSTTALILIPNLICLFLLTFVFFLSNIHLSVNSVIVWCVLIGVAIDDTVFFFYHYSRAQKKGASIFKAIEHVFTNSSHAMIATTLVLFLGFSSAMMSPYRPGFESALALATGVLIALIADLILFPALLLSFEKKAESS